MLDKLNEIEKTALEILNAITRSSRARSLACSECGAQFAVDAGLCRVGETLKGRATRCRGGGEPCEGGA